MFSSCNFIFSLPRHQSRSYLLAKKVLANDAFRSLAIRRTCPARTSSNLGWVEETRHIQSTNVKSKADEST